MPPTAQTPQPVVHTSSSPRLAIFIALVISFLVGGVGGYFLHAKTETNTSPTSLNNDGVPSDRKWVTYSTVVTTTVIPGTSSNTEVDKGFVITVPIIEEYEDSSGRPFRSSVHTNQSGIVFVEGQSSNVTLYLKEQDTRDYTVKEDCAACESYFEGTNTNGVTYYRYGEVREGPNEIYVFPGIDDAKTTLEVLINSHKDYTDEEIAKIINSVDKLEERRPSPNH